VNGILLKFYSVDALLHVFDHGHSLFVCRCCSSFPPSFGLDHCSRRIGNFNTPVGSWSSDSAPGADRVFTSATKQVADC
jgi:hypothetical protein